MDGSEVVAQKKHPCPACGAEALWNPQKQALVCPFCGTIASDVDPEGNPENSDACAENPSEGGPSVPASEILEHDLHAALDGESNAGTTWQAEKLSVKCQQCQAISIFDKTRAAQRCEFCGSSQIVAYEESKPPIRPESLLPLKLGEPQARDILKQWYTKVWFAPNNLSRLSRADTVKGLYLPFWTFDAHAESDWTAEAGHYYYTTESYTDSSGKRATRRVQHTRWEFASGHIAHDFDDELVPATKGVSSSLLRAIEPFPTQELVPYDQSYVRGWVVEQYQVDLPTAARQARERMESEQSRLCSNAVPGDTQRNLNVETEFSEQTFKHILAPVWIVTYKYGATAYQVLVNGVTGQVSGTYPKSWIKIFFAVVCALAVGIIALVIFSHNSGNRIQ